MTTAVLPERFWAKVEKSDTCWLWTAALSKDGYGNVGVVGRRTAAAHRLTYESMVGPIPADLQLDHLCRNRACVNPAHLEPVTAVENIRRSPIHNGHKTHCPQGHEYNEANTYVLDGTRSCRACNRDAVRRYKARRSAKADR